MEIREILEKCDHTLLRVDCTSDEIRRLCDQGIKYNCASVCIPPCHVAGAKRYVGDTLKICTVIGFPNGYNSTAVKAFEAADAVRAGADEVDMVVNLAIGCITPPVGLDLFVVSSITGVSIDKVTAKVMPYLIMLLVDLLLLTYFPSIITFLPNLMH